MGVKDLWQLLAPIGRRVSLETLEGKILAIDMSIWLTQFIKAMRDDEGKMVKNAHILGTLRRILRLLYHKVRPVFVFDGEAPILKTRVLQLRRKAHERSESNRRAAVHKLILAQLKKQAKQHLKQQEQALEQDDEAETQNDEVDLIPDGTAAAARSTSQFSHRTTTSASSGSSRAGRARAGQYAPGFVTASSVSKVEGDQGGAGASSSSATRPPHHPLAATSASLPSSSSSSQQRATLMPSTSPAAASAEVSELADLDTDNIRWTDGRHLPKTKTLEDDLNRGDADEDDVWDLPEDNTQLSVDVLSSLPAHVRKRIIEDARRRERIKSRATYIPVADRPELYSQTQLSNFLSTSKLNQRFEQVQKMIDGSSSEGRKIVAEKHKKYMYIPATTFGSGNVRRISPSIDVLDEDDSAEDEEGSAEKKAEREEQDDDSDVEFTNRDWQQQALPPSGMLAKARLLGKTLGEREQPSGSMTLHRLHKGRKSGALDPSSDVEITDVKEKREAVERDADDDPDSWLDLVEEEKEKKGHPIAERPNPEVVEVDVDDDGKKKEADEDAMDDIAWEDEELDGIVEDDAQQRSYAASNEEDEEQLDRERVDQPSPMVSIGKDEEALEESDAVQPSSREILQDASLLSLPGYGDLRDSANHTQGIEGAFMKESALDRAITTASHMADWAGRVVRRVLKEHIGRAPDADSLHPAAAASSFNSVPAVAATTSISAVGSSGSQMMASTASVGASTETAAIERKTTLSEPATANTITWHSGQDLFAPSTFNATAGLREAQEEQRNQLLDFDSEDSEEIETTIDQSRKALSTSARDTERLTEEMKNDVMQLIQAFGLPFLVAPFEAEAQCAVLEEMGLVDGVVTEDSDSFLFGAQAVYRNIFADKKFVEVYLAEDAKREMGLSRVDLVALAYFLGSDYTEGVNGIGIVNAMEIIQAFPMQDDSDAPLKGMGKFKEWLDGYDFASELLAALERKAEMKADEDEDSEEWLLRSKTEQEKLLEFDRKHSTGKAKWILPENFPDARVAQAYLQPKANRSSEPFQWSPISRWKVRSYCKDVLGWTDELMDAQIDPVLQRCSKRDTQTRIDSHYLTYHDDTRFARIASDRLRSTVVQITGKRTSLGMPGEASRKAKAARKDT